MREEFRWPWEVGPCVFARGEAHTFRHVRLVPDYESFRGGHFEIIATPHDLMTTHPEEFFPVFRAGLFVVPLAVFRSVLIEMASAFFEAFQPIRRVNDREVEVSVGEGCHDFHAVPESKIQRPRTRRCMEQGGRVLLDKVIDVEFAGQSPGGQRVLNAIDKGLPIHTSTGLLATLKEVANSEDGARFEAETMHFDHDATLLDEPGAATPDQGVGMFVNAAGEELEVINSALSDDIERDEMWAIESLLRAEERKSRAGLIERIKAVISDVVRGSPEPELATNQETTDVDQAQFDALSAKVDALAATPPLTLEQVTEVVANALKPITDAAEATAKAAKDELVQKVVNAKLLDQATAEAADTAVLSVLANSIVQTPIAFKVNGAFKPTDKTDRSALVPKGDA